MRSPGTPRRTLLILIALLMLSPVASKVADAQVVIYKLTFRNEIGRSINLEFFTGGFFVAPADGGIGSFVFTRGKGKDKTYTVVENSGQYFVAFNKKQRQGLITAGGGQGTAISGYQLFGNLNSTLRKDGVSYRVPRSLRGVCVAADSELDFDEPAPDGSQGFAGMLDIYAQYQTEFSKRSDSISEALEEIRERLERLGHVEEGIGFTVSAGSDQTVTLGAAASVDATLSGSVSGGTATSTTWSLSSGTSADVTLANENTTTATATFTASGTFTFEFTASDGTNSDSDTVVVTVDP